jgi:hypothetical protein
VSKGATSLGENEFPLHTWYLSYCMPLMLCFDIGSVLGLAHPKNQAKHLSNGR